MENVQQALVYAKSIDIEPLVRSIKEVEIDRKLVAEFLAAGALGLGLIYVGKIWKSYRFFKKRGVKTPPYEFFYGNTHDIQRKGYANTLAEWTEKYGKTYGYFEGHLPILVTSDLEMIDEIFYKKFSNFSARKLQGLQRSDNSSDVNVFLASRNRWKRLRTISNQTFSPAKLKELLPTMRMCSDRLISEISKNLNKDLNITELIDQAAMDIVWNCIFGIDIDLIKNPNFIYFLRIRELLNDLANYGPFFQITSYFYELKPVVLNLMLLISPVISKINAQWGNPFFWLQNQAHEIIDERIGDQNKKKKHDYVQLLIEAEADRVNLDFDNQHYDSGNSKLLEKKMTRSEIVASLISFMIAGFDTTASTINFCLYVLLTHPDEMSKLVDEVDTLEDYEYESLNKLEYLDLFIKEVLRMYPVGEAVQDRRCTKATTLKGIDIPENLLISVDVLSLHYDPENWPEVDPNVFYPSRFGPDAKYNKLAYMPFGAGARTCIGMRFALLEIKLTLAKILRNFEISSAVPLTQKPEIRDAIFTVQRPKYPLKIIFKKRN